MLTAAQQFINTGACVEEFGGLIMLTVKDTATGETAIAALEPAQARKLMYNLAGAYMQADRKVSHAH